MLVWVKPHQQSVFAVFQGKDFANFKKWFKCRVQEIEENVYIIKDNKTPTHLFNNKIQKLVQFQWFEDATEKIKYLGFFFLIFE